MMIILQCGARSIQDTRILCARTLSQLASSQHLQWKLSLLIFFCHISTYRGSSVLPSSHSLDDNHHCKSQFHSLVKANRAPSTRRLGNPRRRTIRKHIPAIHTTPQSELIARYATPDTTPDAFGGILSHLIVSGDADHAGVVALLRHRCGRPDYLHDFIGDYDLLIVVIAVGSVAPLIVSIAAA
mmetsp:Transcript_27129/g.55786  ORF Transcript_27129/g.55786 Transcript_27129/m.55786 type:complete len:184 (-) Transcript_27129:230-781(-)